jgi:hypothetical protein
MEINMGPALCQSKIKHCFLLLQNLCDRLQDPNHLVSDIFIEDTTLPLKRGHYFFLMCYRHGYRPHCGSQLIGHSLPLSHIAGMQKKKISDTPQDLFHFSSRCLQDSKSSALTLVI